MVDDRTTVLVNDIDLLLIDPAGKPIYPYALDVDGKLRPRNGPNRTDNVEVIDAAPYAGQWRIRIIAPRLRDGRPQRVSLVTRGFRREVAPNEP